MREVKKKKRCLLAALALLLATSMLVGIPGFSLAYADEAPSALDDIQGVFDGFQAEAEQVFQLVVKTTAANETFYLPTSGYLNGRCDGKGYDWLVYWGDGSSSIEAGTSSTDGGIPHVYAQTGMYGISITPAGSTEAWLGAFGFMNTTMNALSNSVANKGMVMGVLGPITPQMTRTDAQVNGTATPPNHEWSRTFWRCPNMVIAPSFEGWEGVRQAGDYFADSLFSDCTGLVTLPANCSLPPDLTSVGRNFAGGMFYNCLSLTTLPDGFNLPQGITEIGNSYFASSMFIFCESLTGLPEGFNLPQGITDAKNDFASSMFFDCYSLTYLPESFNLPQSITKAGNHFCFWMFNDCSSLANMPRAFNLPQGVTEAGINFAANMFYYAGGPTFQVNDVFCFPLGVRPDVSFAFGCILYLAANAPIQSRTAASIIGSYPLPNGMPRNAFGRHFTDLDYIPVGWGGGGMEPPPVGEPGSGDLNGDGVVTMDEVIMALRASVGSLTLTTAQFAAIDMDFDGAITVTDVVMMLRKTL